MLDRAERLLGNDDEIRSSWTARVWELRAQALQLRGEEDEADYLARMAVDSYEELGEWAKAGELRSRLDVRSREVRPGPAPAAVRLRLLPSGGLEAEAILPDAPRSAPRDYYPTHPLVRAAALADLTADPGSPAERVPFELLSRLTEDWASLGANLGALMLDAAGATVMTMGQSGGLSIEIEDRKLQAVPWELARAAPGQPLLSGHPFTGALYRGSGVRKAIAREVRFAQIALNRTTGARLGVDGLLGSRTGAALRDFQAARRLQATGELDAETMHALRQELTAERSTGRLPVAMILRASLSRQTAQSRGEWIQGFDVSRSYAMAGFLPYVVESPWIDDLEFAELAKQQPTPAVLHISSGFSASAGLLALDFVEGNQTRGTAKEATAGGIAATTLDRFMQRLPAAEPSPLVILDVPRPPGPTEAARLLLLRNLFAADLFALRSTPIIVATGLTTGCTPELYDRLIGALAAGRSAASAVYSVRQLGVASEDASRASEFPDEAALAATALFADAPSLGLVAALESGG